MYFHTGNIIIGICLIVTSVVIYKLMEYFVRSLKNRISGPILYSGSIIIVSTLISAAFLSLYYSFVPLRENSIGWALIWYWFLIPLVIFFGIISGFLYKIYKSGSPLRPAVLFSLNVLSVLILGIGIFSIVHKLDILKYIVRMMS